MKSSRNCGNLTLTPSSSCCKILSIIYSWAGFLLGLSNVLYWINDAPDERCHQCMATQCAHIGLPVCIMHEYTLIECIMYEYSNSLVTHVALAVLAWACANWYAWYHWLHWGVPSYKIHTLFFSAAKWRQHAPTRGVVLLRRRLRHRSDAGCHQTELHQPTVTVRLPVSIINTRVSTFSVIVSCKFCCIHVLRR